MPSLRRLLSLALVATAGAIAPSHAAPGVADARLAAAGRATPVRAIDYDRERCDERTVEQWLVALTAGQARAITWTGGPCQLVGPGIDSGSRWCAQGVVHLVHPRGPRDRPTIEVFFEAPIAGRPGPAYAFRGSMEASDGPDMSRFRHDFEADWTSRFPAPAGAITGCEIEPG